VAITIAIGIPAEATPRSREGTASRAIVPVLGNTTSNTTPGRVDGHRLFVGARSATVLRRGDRDRASAYRLDYEVEVDTRPLTAR